MYCIIRVFNGPDKPLTYAVPSSWQHLICVGKIVHVPLLKRTERGMVVDILPPDTSFPYPIRDIYNVEPMPDDGLYYRWIEQISTYYATEPWKLVQRFFSFKTVHKKFQVSVEVPYISFQHDSPSLLWKLTNEQAEIVARITPFIHQAAYRPALLQGVTGSGKTAVYQALLREAHAAQKTSLFLLPEVSLAMTLAQTLRSLFQGNVEVHEYHYAISASQKNILWKKINAGAPIVIVGVRLPVFLPLVNLGLIIVDEEHDPNYQESAHPRINTKEAALLRAQHYKIPIVLGSATPSLSSVYVARQRAWEFFHLKERFAGSFPSITRVPLVIARKKEASQFADAFWITAPLREAIAVRLQRKEQVVIFLNRRGLYRFIQCSDCTNIVRCSACSVSCTLHETNMLRCHYCGVQQHSPPHCPACGSSAPFLKKGIGTQRLVEILRSLFPSVRIARADIDSKKEQKSWAKTVAAMLEGQIDILVGTQIITKGYHFPNVTLVGIIWAESNLSTPFYTAAESTLQQLLQVAGRAGRAHKGSEVIVQSYSRHQLFSYLNESNYQQFYEYELEQRKSPCYPPFARLSEIELQHSDEHILNRDAQKIAVQARTWTDATSIEILGPALPPVHRIKHTSLRRIYLKGGTITAHLELFHKLKDMMANEEHVSRIFFTPNPLH